MTIDASRLTVELVSVDDIDTVLATFPYAIAHSWQEPFAEPGNGSIVLKATDADLALVERGGRQLLYYLLDGVRVFGIVLEDYENVAVSRAEEKAQNRTEVGPGLLALTRRARVYPTLGPGRRPVEDARAFNWTSPDCDASAWVPATVLESAADAKLPGGWPIPIDPDFPDDGASMLWASSGTISLAPVGRCYFRQTITIYTPGTYTIYFLFGVSGELAVDGQLVAGPPNSADPSSAYKTRDVAVELSAGDHLIACVAENVFYNNPGGIAWSLCTVTADGVKTPQAHSDSSAVVLEYPADVPGMTPGQALKIAIDEAQARGCFPYLLYDFDEEVDSEGTPWPVVGDIATKVGTDVLTFIRELAGTYIDVRMGLDLWLHAYVKGTYGESLAVELHPALDPTDPTSGNLAELSHKGEATPLNAALIRSPLGWHELTRDASIAAYERIETEVGLGALSTLPEVYRVTEGIFDEHDAPREEVNATVASGGPTPYIDYDLADTITVPDSDGAPVVRPVVTITVDHTAGSDSVDVAPTLGEVILPPDARAMQAVKKMIEGTGSGRFKEAQPVPSVYVPRAAPAAVVLPAFYESFDKADGVPLGPDLTWTDFAAFGDPPEVLSNAFVADYNGGGSVNAHAYADAADVGSSDMSAQCTAVELATSSTIVIYLRIVIGGSNTMLAAKWDDVGTGYQASFYALTPGVVAPNIATVGPGAGGGATIIGAGKIVQADHRLSVDDVLRFDAAGTTLSMYVNEELVATALDFSGIAGHLGGLGLSLFTSPSVTRLDNFVVRALA